MYGLSKKVYGLSNSSFTRIAEGVGMEPVMFDVESSNIWQIGYDSENMDLYVRFLPKGNRESTMYVYNNVEPEVWEGFFAAESKGRYLHQYIKLGGYQYERIE